MWLGVLVVIILLLIYFKTRARCWLCARRFWWERHRAVCTSCAWTYHNLPLWEQARLFGMVSPRSKNQ